MGRLCVGSGRTGPPYAGALLTFCGRFLQLNKCGARAFTGTGASVLVAIRRQLFARPWQKRLAPTIARD